jgi:hypothetical protein
MAAHVTAAALLLPRSDVVSTYAIGTDTYAYSYCSYVSTSGVHSISILGVLLKCNLRYTY